MQNSPYTIEGELEGFARLGTGTRRASGKLRAVAYVLVAGLLLPFGIAAYNGLRWFLTTVF